ncbi:MAG: response regulator [Thermoleophilaceae bacterium]|nr:response regulator [Thermoleophilaceae bacterium]
MAETPETTREAATKVLVVEDSPTQLEQLRFLLEDSGFSVVVARNGREGLAAARANPVDLVVSDIMMPEMDGYALCKALRADEKLRHVPVILLTSLADPRDVIQGLESGANNFICKPYDDRALVARVKNVLANQEIRKASSSEMGITIYFAGQRFFITADRLQILDLLLSTYENAVSQNTELTRTRDQFRALNEQLEARVAERTAALTTEIEERKRAAEALRRSEERLQALFERVGHLNRVLDAIRNVNRLIVREKDPARLVQQACELLIETRGYHGAWIALGAEGSPRSAPAQAGWGAGFEPFARRFEEGCWPACRASASAADAVAVLDPEAACRECPLRSAYNSDLAAVSCLRHAGRDFGMLGVSVPRGVPIDEEERAILLEVAGDIAFALHGIEMETERRKSEQTLLAIFQSASDGILLADAESGRFVVGNDAICRMLGYSHEEMRGLSVASIHPAEHLDYVRAQFDRQARGEISLVADIAMKCKDGTVFPADVNSAPVELDGRRCLLGIFRDITERKRTEGELRVKDRALESSINAVALGGLDGKLTYVNAAFLRMWGYRDRREVEGRSAIGFWASPDDAAQVMAALQKTGQWSGEMRASNKDGGEFDVELAACMILGVDGEPTGLFAAFQDITERKRAQAEREKIEEQLRVSQKMEAIGALAGGVAHDFNNLLSVILSYTEFAMQAVGEGNPLRDDLLEVKRAGQRAEAVVRQLLAFGRKQVLQPVPLSLNQVVAGLEKMLRRILGEGIDLVQVLSPDLGTVRADPGQMEQVLMNLVVNARDAMPEGGKLTIETRSVEIDEEYAARHVTVTPGSYVQLAVTDTGCGMDREVKARLFEPFFTTKGIGKGTGLGLPTVYGIVKQSGGNIWVYSEPGRGTTFKVYLPRVFEAAVGSTPPPASPRRVTGTETILVVEDEAALREVARRALDAAGCKVLTARNGEEALAVAAQHAAEIHLLLTDVVMPRMGGRILAERLTAARPGLRVLFTSGYTDNAIVHHGVLDAGTHFLAKPFTATELTRKVREVLDHDPDGPPVPRAPSGDAAARPPDRLLDPEVVRALAPELRKRLRQAVVSARQDELVALLEASRQTAPEAVDGLLRLVDRFDYDGLRDLLAPSTEDADG